VTLSNSAHGTTNAGQCLFGGIAERAPAARTIERLFEDDIWTGWGLRTLSQRATVQSDELPQRVDLAARQRAGGGRLLPITATRVGLRRS
jgi:hypothetical protein